MIRSSVTISLVPEARGGPFVFWDDIENACHTAKKLEFFVLIDQKGAPASGAWIAAAGAVSKNVDSISHEGLQIVD